mgnify:FL=1
MNNKLTDQEKEVIEKKGTEAPFSGKYYNHKENGTYICKKCGSELYSSNAKFDSGTGWPSFTKPLESENIVEKTDKTLGVTRTEVRSKNADSHLGHVFDDGPKETTGKRYCINSVCLDLEEK